VTAAVATADTNQETVANVATVEPTPVNDEHSELKVKAESSTTLFAETALGLTAAPLQRLTEGSAVTMSTAEVKSDQKPPPVTPPKQRRHPAAGLAAGLRSPGMESRRSFSSVQSSASTSSYQSQRSERLQSSLADGMLELDTHRSERGHRRRKSSQARDRGLPFLDITAFEQRFAANSGTTDAARSAYQANKRMLVAHFKQLFSGGEQPFGFLVSTFLSGFRREAACLLDAQLSPRLVQRQLDRVFKFVTLQQAFVQLAYTNLASTKTCLRLAMDTLRSCVINQVYPQLVQWYRVINL
jgi:hypothetical protein